MSILKRKFNTSPMKAFSIKTKEIFRFIQCERILNNYFIEEY